MVVRDNFTTHAGLVARSKSQVLASPADYQYCRKVMVGASRNYSFAGQFLPPEKRRHVEALYAFLRVGDDRVDVSHEGFDSAAAAIDDWEMAYRRVFRLGTSDHPVIRAYYATARAFGIPERLMDPFFRAMRADLSVTRFPRFDDLLEYMDGSAVPVGRAMTYILGVRPGHTLERALAHADSLSIAMQLSNFWRDIGEDWARGRVYLPQEDLDRFRVPEEDLGARRMSPALRRVLQFEIERTEAYYRHAQEGVPMLATGRWAVQSGLSIYRAILTSLRKGGFDPFVRRAGASDREKALLVAKAWLEAR